MRRPEEPAAISPLVAISSQYDSDPGRFGILCEYVEFLRSGGLSCVVLPFGEEAENMKRFASMLDGIVVPGGDDIERAAYIPDESGALCGSRRDIAEIELVRLAMDCDIPFLGICRGMQIANVACGGTLIEDIPSAFSDRRSHWQDKPPHEPHHAIGIHHKTMKTVLGSGDDVHVNSLHHQCIDRLGGNLEVCAISDDGLVEAICNPRCSFFLGVQWHPELMPTSASSAAILNAFALSCRARAERKALI